METHEFDTVISAVGIVANTEGLGWRRWARNSTASFVSDGRVFAARASKGFSSSATRRTGRGSPTRPATQGVMVPKLIAGGIRMPVKPR